jgi:stearoyl-CoA desaturase (delta-9 desaturase)
MTTITGTLPEMGLAARVAAEPLLPAAPLRPAAPSGATPETGNKEPSPDGSSSFATQLLYGAPFIFLHFLPLAAIVTGVNTIDVVVCIGLYVVRMFGVTGAYHRYFAHRTYHTSRVFQFVLALLAMSSSQRGVLWWAAHHRHHHKHSDLPTDIHSPKQVGLFKAHVGWLFEPANTETRFDKIKDYAKYPELVFLDKNWYLPQTILGFLVWHFLGWSGLWIGFVLSTVLLWHGTFTINSLTHVWGKKVYESGDESKNSFILALVTLGEGWHNNHHYYQACARQGFHWWQIDITYYTLRALAKVGLIWDIREPPAEVVAGTWGRKVSEVA